MQSQDELRCSIKQVYDLLNEGKKLTRGALKISYTNESKSDILLEKQSRTKKILKRQSFDNNEPMPIKKQKSAVVFKLEIKGPQNLKKILSDPVNLVEKLIKLQNSLMVVLRVLIEGNGGYSILVRKIEGVTEWINIDMNQEYQCEIYQNVNMKNLFLTGFQNSLSKEDIIYRFLIESAQSQSIYEFLTHHQHVNRQEDRCTLCHYILGQLDFMECALCQRKVHQHCLNRSKDKWTNTESNKWHCSNCTECSICQCVNNNEDLITCEKCQMKFHKFCLSQQHKTFSLCAICIKCTWCDMSTPHSVYHEIDQQNLLCLKCKQIYERKEYCLICKQEWDSNTNNAFIQCDTEECQMWLHMECDQLLLSQPQLFNLHVRDFNIKYRCPKCRIKVRRALRSNMLRLISYFDSDRNFWQADHTNVKYLEVIKKPMDFVTIYNKIEKDEYNDSDAIFEDVILAVKNCQTYNPANHRVYRRALMIEQIFNLIFPLLKEATELSEEIISKYQEEEHSLLNIKDQLIQTIYDNFLMTALKTQSSYKPKINVNYIWEKQLLSFSSIKLQSISNIHQNRLIVFERQINPIYGFENEREPLIKFSYTNFARYLVQAMPKRNGNKNTETQQPNQLSLYFNNLLEKETFKRQLNNQQFKIQLSQIIYFACSTCGGFDNSYNLLFCSYCEESHHFYCAIGPQILHMTPDRVLQALSKNIDKQWLCQKCSSCNKCQKGIFKQNDLFCSLCSNFYHYKCMIPSINRFPDEHLELWKCPKCFSCQNCKSSIIFDEESMNLMRNNQLPLCLEYTHNFTYCFLCGLQKMNKRICEYCNKIVQHDAEREIVSKSDSYKEFKRNSKYIHYQSCENIFYQFFEYINQRSNRIINSKNQQTQKCVRCFASYHSQCLISKGIALTLEGYCIQCTVPQEDLFKKYEEEKKQQIYLQYVERTLDKLRPFLNSYFQSRGQQWNQISEDTQDSIIKNISQLEDAYQKYEQFEFQVDKIKIQLFDKYIQESTIYNFLEYWLLNFPDHINNLHLSLRNDNIFFNPQQNDIQIVDFDYLEYKITTLADFTKSYPLSLLISLNNLMAELFPYNYFHINHEIVILTQNLQLSSILCEAQSDISLPPHYNEVFYEMFLPQIFQKNIIYYNLSKGIKNTIQNIRYQVLQNQKYCSQGILIESNININLDISNIAHTSICLGERKLKKYYQEMHLKYSPSEISQKLNELKGYIIFKEKCMVDLVNYCNYIFTTRNSPQPQQQQQTQTISKVIQQNPTHISIQPLQKITSLIQETEQLSKLQNSLISGPNDDLVCFFCNQNGTRRLSGRLLQYDAERWIHANCAIWSEETKENPDGNIVGIAPQIKCRNNSSCFVCKQDGASMVCLNGNCKKKFHFYCSFKNKNALFSNRKTLCCSCLLDAQALAVELNSVVQDRYSRFNRCVFLKSALNEALNSSICQDFSVFRKLTFVKQSQKDEEINLITRFGNTILLDLIYDEHGLFRTLRFLYNRANGSFTQHIFFEITQIKQSYSISTKIMLNEDLIKIIRQITRANISAKLVSKLEDFFTDQNEFPSTQQSTSLQELINCIYQNLQKTNVSNIHEIQQILLTLGVFQNISQCDIDDLIGYAFLFQTQLLKTKLLSDQSHRVTTSTILSSFNVNKIIPTCTEDLFYKGGIFENHSFQTRMQQIQWLQRQNLLKFQKMQKEHIENQNQIQSLSQINIKQQNKMHKTLIDLKPMQKSIVPSVQDTKILSNVLPSDILYEAQQDRFNVQSEIEWNQEIVRRLRKEYLNNKKQATLLYVAPSRIHKYGLYTKQKIKQYELVIEYTGEYIRNSLADQREKNYIERGFGDCYLFRASKDRVIDATFLGSQARYLNHSCESNCASAIVEINGEPKIIMYAKRDIYTNEELTYDYQFEVDSIKIECFCGSINCVGRLN